MYLLMVQSTAQQMEETGIQLVGLALGEETLYLKALNAVIAGMVALTPHLHQMSLPPHLFLVEQPTSNLLS